MMNELIITISDENTKKSRIYNHTFLLGYSFISLLLILMEITYGSANYQTIDQCHTILNYNTWLIIQGCMSMCVELITIRMLSKLLANPYLENFLPTKIFIFIVLSQVIWVLIGSVVIYDCSNKDKHFSKLNLIILTSSIALVTVLLFVKIVIQNQN